MIYKLKDLLFFLINGKTKYRLHSPFVFNFVKTVLLDDRKFYAFELIKSIKKTTQKNTHKIPITDLGAGSGGRVKSERSISAITNKSAIKHKYGKLLFRIVNYYKPENILELGTCIGIGTMYLATGNLKSKVITIEGDPNIATIAKTNFDRYPGGLDHIELMEGNFDTVLPKALAALQKVDLAFIDGNHRKAPTLNYFHQILPYCDQSSILIFDDIHWSKEMMEAWKVIQNHPDVSLTLDLYRLGIVFFGKERKEQEHFQLYF